MKTIAQYVQDGITTLPDLKDALQLAMQLEFSTIPPYLCAQWSIDPSADPDGVSSMIENIAVQEMFHFALAGNLLSAIGGTPNIANASFIPAYPTNVLPGGIAQELPVDLQPLSLNQLQVFMQIEFPDYLPDPNPVNPGKPATIGAFYTEIASGFSTIKPTIGQNAYFVNMGEAVQITDIPGALAAIARIQAEGEGTQGSPDQPPADNGQLAHYYVFKEIFDGQTLAQNGNPSVPIHFPKNIYQFSQSNASPDPSIGFNQALSRLLISLQTCWTTPNAAQPSRAAMMNLWSVGQGLITQQIRPEFVWAESATGASGS